MLQSLKLVPFGASPCFLLLCVYETFVIKPSRVPSPSEKPDLAEHGLGYGAKSPSLPDSLLAAT